MSNRDLHTLNAGNGRRSSRHLRAVLAAALWAGLAAPGGAQEPAAPPADQAPAAEAAVQAPPPDHPWPAPMYNDRRFEENWEPIDWTNPHKGARDWFDNIKAIKFDDDGDVWIGFGGQLRGRMARQSTVYFGGPPADFEPVMWTWRGKAYTDLHLGKKFRVFGEYGYSYTEIDDFRLGSAGPKAPNLNGDAVNLFAEFKTPVGKEWKVGLWAGRRELQFGHERVISPGNWLLNQHTFDGGGGWIEKNNHRLEGFVTRPRIPVPDMWRDRDDNTIFSGLVYTTAMVDAPPAAPGAAQAPRPTRITFQPYVLHIKRDKVTFVQNTADESRFTFGLLAYGDVGRTGFDFEYEGMYQYGHWSTPYETGPIHAHSTTLELGYRLTNVKFYPRPAVTFDYASGDDDPSDMTLKTFDPLFPLAYAFWGFHAAFDRKNFVAPGIKVDMVLRRNMFLTSHLWPGFWRAAEQDGYYNTFNALIRRPEPQSKGRGFENLNRASMNLGNQWDVGVAWLPNHHLLIYGTYLRFNAGPFFSETQTAPKDNMNGVMVLTQYTF